MWGCVAPEPDGIEEGWRIEHEDFHAGEQLEQWFKTTFAYQLTL